MTRPEYVEFLLTENRLARWNHVRARSNNIELTVDEAADWLVQVEKKGASDVRAKEDLQEMLEWLQ